jgi:excisionase family DNA binding protein
MPRKVEYVNAVEAARLTGLSEKTIRRKLDAGELKAEKRGTVYAIRVTDLLTLHKQFPDLLTTHIQELEEQLKWQAEHISKLERRVQELERRSSSQAI